MGISTIDILQVLPSSSRRRIISTAERLGWVAESRTCLCGDPPSQGCYYVNSVISLVYHLVRTIISPATYITVNFCYKGSHR